MGKFTFSFLKSFIPAASCGILLCKEVVTVQWNLEEAISYYQTMGAPRDQSALVSLLREIQQEHGGSIPPYIPELVARAYGVKASFLLAIIKRIPSLRLGNSHCLELCAGPNCGKHTALVACAEKLHTASGKQFILKFGSCMRMCGKGPNIKWDGVLYHKADEALLRKLLQEAGLDI